MDLVNLAFAGHRGLNGERFRVKYETQFNEIAPGLYKYYRTLCDMAHGAMASHMLKCEMADGKIWLDNGIEFKPEDSTFVMNQYSVYLLAHLEFMKTVFPEIDNQRTEEYMVKEREVLATLWGLMKEISEKDQNKRWYEAVRLLVKV